MAESLTPVQSKVARALGLYAGTYWTAIARAVWPLKRPRDMLLPTYRVLLAMERSGLVDRVFLESDRPPAWRLTSKGASALASYLIEEAHRV